MAQAVKQNIGRRWLLLGALIVLVLVFYGVRTLTREKLPLRVAEVVRGDLISQISTNGKVEPEVNFEAHSPIAATVRNLFVHEGDKVPAGKLLLELNAADAAARLAAA